MIMQRGEHLTIEGIQKIVNIRAYLNKGLTTVLKPLSLIASIFQYYQFHLIILILNYILNG